MAFKISSMVIVTASIFSLEIFGIVDKILSYEIALLSKLRYNLKTSVRKVLKLHTRVTICEQLELI